MNCKHDIVLGGRGHRKLTSWLGILLIREAGGVPVSRIICCSWFISMTARSRAYSRHILQITCFCLSPIQERRMERRDRKQHRGLTCTYGTHNAAKNNSLDLKLCIMVIPRENTAGTSKAKINILFINSLQITIKPIIPFKNHQSLHLEKISKACSTILLVYIMLCTQPSLFSQLRDIKIATTKFCTIINSYIYRFHICEKRIAYHQVDLSRKTWKAMYGSCTTDYARM